jgi:hypothetical protein
MNHSMGTMRNKQTLAIAAMLLVSALIAIYGFNVARGTLAPLTFLAFFVWMHVGGHASTALATVGRATPRPAVMEAIKASSYCTPQDTAAQVGS